MTEAEWLACVDPEPLLSFLDECLHTEKERDYRTSYFRKLRLFSIGCCRHIERLLTDTRSRDALVVIDRYLEGSATEEDKVDAALTASQVSNYFDAEGMTDGRRGAASAVYRTLDDIQDEFTDARDIAEEAADAIGIATDMADSASADAYDRAKGAEQAHQAALLRDIFGNPFHPVTLSSAWRTDTAVSLAQQMYDSRDFSAMPILADALQDAGCDNTAILDHCRGPGPHVRGCWVVDLVLGKE